AGPRQPGAPPPPGAGVPRWGCRSGPGDDLPRCVGVPHPSQRLRGELLRSICAHLGEGKDQLFPALERLPGGVRARARSPPAVLTDAACAGRSRVCGASGGAVTVQGVESSWCALVEHRGSVGGPGPSPSVVFLGLPSLDGRTVASRRSMPTDGVLPNCIGLLAVQPTRRKGHGVLRRMRQAPEKD
ncbi:unnamed protein product, partial [Prorocentrum cordatum]